MYARKLSISPSWLPLTLFFIVFINNVNAFSVPRRNTRNKNFSPSSSQQKRIIPHNKNSGTEEDNIPTVVLVTGFESFNRQLYLDAASKLNSSSSSSAKINLKVFSDTEIRQQQQQQQRVNPELQNALENADLFIGSLIFDYDDVLTISELLPQVPTRLLFECATEIMELNKVGSFNMMPKDDGEAAGPPPVVKALLSKFSSGKEEDKLSGYLKLLKIGPQLLQYVPGSKALDLRTWLEAYRYWNQGGIENASSMFQLLYQRCLQVSPKNNNNNNNKGVAKDPNELKITPDIGLLHPLYSSFKHTSNYFISPAQYLRWRKSKATALLAKEKKYKLAHPTESPRVAILLYRKHVITNQKYIWDLITSMESQNIMPIPIFINGVEAHTIVRDLLTSNNEIELVNKREIKRDNTYSQSDAVSVDAIINTIGFPLVGGPAGSMEAGRNVELAQTLLNNMNVPYVVASPLLLQGLDTWRRSGVLGLQSVVLYSLPELDGAIDTIVLGGLVGDKIALVPERVRKLGGRIKSWVKLRQTPKKDRKISIIVYGFPPNVGAVGTAALLDVPKSLEKLLLRLHEEGYDVGDFASSAGASASASAANGESLVAALAVMCEEQVIAGGAKRMESTLQEQLKKARAGDKTIPETLSNPNNNGGLGNNTHVRGFDISNEDLDKSLGKYMAKKVRKAWPQVEKLQYHQAPPGVSSSGDLVVSGLQVGNVWISVQPLLGVEGDPMRLLFERDLTPHPQYCAFYHWMKKPELEGGIGTDAVIHLGMHGTVEWLPGQPLGNDRDSWADELLGNVPNLYVYAANNPSESILAKRRGYGTLISYNVPPYGRSGLYLELANLRDLVNEYRMNGEDDDDSRRDLIWESCQRSGLFNDVPLVSENGDVITPDSKLSLHDDVVSLQTFNDWVSKVSDYLVVLQDRLFSSGLHTLGSVPTNDEFKSYLNAYFGDDLSDKECDDVIRNWTEEKNKQSNNFDKSGSVEKQFEKFISGVFPFSTKGQAEKKKKDKAAALEMDKDKFLKKEEAYKIVSLLAQNTDEINSLMNALDGGYVKPKPGGDLLRDGSSVLPTGRNIHSLDPYRMPSQFAWSRGQKIAEEVIRQHRCEEQSSPSMKSLYPETVAVTLWGLDAIKTRGESVAIVLALVGATPVREGTGRVVRFDLIPLEELGRPRIDVLASLSGIFRDSFANIVDLLDDMFERAAVADEPCEMNFIKKHALELISEGVEERPAARLFSNPPGDYGSMVNEVVSSGDWEEDTQLGETWSSRNAFSYGRNEGSSSTGESNDLERRGGTKRKEVLEKLLATTERIVQEIDSVEYGLTDIQEYYANTGALKVAAENRRNKTVDPNKTEETKKTVKLSIVEAFSSSSGRDSDAHVPVKDVDDVLRLEYRSKLLNPKWRDKMIDQGSGGAYEISQRMTALIGWAATANVDNFVFDQSAERYALDENIANKLQKANPEAFRNVIRRLLEAEARNMWQPSDETILDKLRDLYSDADDLVEKVG